MVSVAELRQSVPDAARKEYQLGLKLVAKGDVKNAATHFQQALSIYPEYLAARNDLGAQFLKLKQFDEAEKHFQTVIANDPKNFNAKYNLGTRSHRAKRLCCRDLGVESGDRYRQYAPGGALMAWCCTAGNR